MTDSQSVADAKADRRAQLLEVGKTRLVRDGYAKTSVAAIVRDAGVAQGTFYLYFKSKQELVRELRRQVFFTYAAVLDEVATLDVPEDERVAILIRRMSDVVRDNLELERAFRTAESAQTTELAALEGRARLAERTQRGLATGVESGRFAAHASELAAPFIVTLFDNVLFEAHAYGRPAPVDVVVREGIRFALAALGVEGPRIDELCRP